MIYDANCAVCHGSDGNWRNSPIGPALNPPPPDWSIGEVRIDANENGTPGEQEDLFLVTRNGAAAFGGSPLMAPWAGALADAEIQAVVEFIEVTFLLREPMPTPTPLTDSDGDGEPDATDNCILVANGPTIPDAGGNVQLDVDGDGFGNACDCDFNQDAGCGQPDYSIFLACFGQFVPARRGPADDPHCQESNMNGDGGVGQPDYSLFISRFGGAPGP